MKSKRIDHNEFFRQATMRICGSLDLERAMERCLTYLSGVMPGSSLCLHLYRPDLNAIETVTAVDLGTKMRLSHFIRLPEGIENLMVVRWNQFGKIRIINNPELFPESRVVVADMDKSNFSVLSMRLELEGERIGVVTILAEEKDRYQKSHASLLLLLHDPFAIAVSNALRYREVLALKENLEDDNQYLHQELLRISGDEIIGAEYGLRDVMEMVRQVTTLNSPVLLLGETGVGKEVIANAVHYSSERRDGPFIKVNCGAIPDSLMDSELFGHEKGAFTGAVTTKRGRFERANKGTLFLDEIGELPLPAQVRLLRVIQSGELERVGGSKTIRVDVRIISATHRNLEEMVRSGGFREDLFFRINVFPITIPPLRQRRGDIPALVNYFLHRKVGELRLPCVPEISKGSLAALSNYSFRGNVRELENIVERALIRYNGGPVSLDIPERRRRPVEGVETENEPVRPLDEVNRSYIKKILMQAKGKIHGSGGAAELLGIHPNTLRKRMDKLEINYKKR